MINCFGDFYIYLVGDSFVWKGNRESVLEGYYSIDASQSALCVMGVDSLIDVTLVFAKY